METAGVVLQVPEDGPRPDAGVVAEALAAPGPPVPAAVALGSMDMWDGFGLWLALTEPRACRILQRDPDADLAADLRPLGPSGGTVGLVAVPGDPMPGLAAVEPTSDLGRLPGPVAVHPFGPGGPGLAAWLRTALERWAAAGRPEAADWLLTVVPAGRIAPPSPVTVEKRHSRVLATLPTDRNMAP
ncbi:hypothetical protein BJF78_21645 [Pseudonocardia sp. CNS-139]|nr:hypothetical protein BJF78_21645 [Pseudonocardia sp. CNS-139]